MGDFDLLLQILKELKEINLNILKLHKTLVDDRLFDLKQHQDREKSHV